MNPRTDDAIVVVTMWFVYIVRCSDDSFIGETNDLDYRLLRRNKGRASAFTARRRPVVLVYSEQCATRQTALTRERQLKCWIRAKKEALIAGDSVLLKRL